jgi:hypothetical protein
MSYEQARALMDRGVSRPTLFALTLPNLVNRRTNDYLNLFCRATAIPEIRTATAFVNGHERMGISREQPTAIRFGKPFRIEVIENSEFSVYQDLRQWFDMTCVDINDPRASQRMNYYESYVQDMQLHKLELPDNLLGALGSAELTANYKRVMTINFVNAYPINIGAISLNTESRNTVTTYSVDFTYESYSIGDTTGVGGQLF